MNFTPQDIARCALGSSCAHEHPYTEKKTYLYYGRYQCKQCAYDDRTATKLQQARAARAAVLEKVAG